MKQESFIITRQFEASLRQLKDKAASLLGMLNEAKGKHTLLKRILLVVFGTSLTVSGALGDEFGLATYYHNPSHGGLIAAHPTLSFGTRLRVHNLDNGRSAVVTVVDRGPFARGRIIDVSTVAADALGMRQAGVARVRLELMQ